MFLLPYDIVILGSPNGICVSGFVLPPDFVIPSTYAFQFLSLAAQSHVVVTQRDMQVGALYLVKGKKIHNRLVPLFFCLTHSEDEPACAYLF